MTDSLESWQITELYRERAALLAHIAVYDTNAALAYNSSRFPEWPVLYLRRGGESWHINPEHLKFFAHVPLVDDDDPRVQWDGHTVDEKYELLHRETQLLARKPTRPGQAWVTDPNGKPQYVEMYLDHNDDDRPF